MIPKCGNPKCNHPRENHGVICNGSIECFCEYWVEPILEPFFQEVEVNKEKLKTNYERCKYILSKLPPTRNAGSKTFYKIYNEIWHGVKIRKKISMQLTPELWKRLPVSSSVNRAKRFVKDDYPELQTYDPETLFHQQTLYQAIVEMSRE